MANTNRILKKGKRILYVISFIDVRDGAASSVFFQSRMDKEFFDDYLIVCKWKGKCPDDFNIVCIDENEEAIKSFLTDRDRVIIHYYKATNSNIFNRVCRLVDSSVPIIMTVCQNPAYRQYLLSPFEISHSWKIVFIDKSSYNNDIVSFIPSDKKKQIYLAGKMDIEKTKNIPIPDNYPYVIFGRGSTLSKCPKNMFEVFDNIKTPNKKFVVVGIPEGDNWVRREAQKRTNVEIYPKLEREEWFKRCATFNIFLYQLPEYCHASIDGTLGLAMLMKQPVVYMGCDAPKERIHHGINGFIANSKEEFSSYATLLGNDIDLRIKMGKAARETTINDFSPDIRKKEYFDLYENITTNSKVKIPIIYHIKYIFRCYKNIIRSIFNIYPKSIDF